MSTRKAVCYGQAMKNSAFGNLNTEKLVEELTSEAADNVVTFGPFESSTELHKLNLHYDALGAGSGLKLGVAFDSADDGTDDDDKYLTIADTSAAGKATWEGVPERIDTRFYLSLTVTGAAATGTVTLVPTYLYYGS